METLQPKLRFPQFDRNWESKIFKKTCEINPSNKKLPKKFIYIDLESVNNGSLNKENEILLDEAPSRAQRLLNKEDVLFQMVRPYQKNNFYFDKEGDYVASTGYAQLRANDSSKFLFQYLHNQTFVDKVIEKCTGSNYPAINSTDLANIFVVFPDNNEQTKIANFLSGVDEKLNLLKEKKALLEDYKKGIMQKIFNQEIRFKDDNGEDFEDWKENFIGNILKIGSGRDYKHLNFGNVPVFGTGGLMTYVDSYLHRGETVCIGRKGTIDKPMYYNGDIWTVDTLFYIHTFNKSVPKFVYYVFQSINWKQHNEASGVPSLSKSTIEQILIEVPSVPEQTKIANFLSAIDEKVELVSNQIQDTQEYKKGLLQQMFV